VSQRKPARNHTLIGRLHGVFNGIAEAVAYWPAAVVIGNIFQLLED
jgi:hypothetical protein